MPPAVPSCDLLYSLADVCCGCDRLPIEVARVAPGEPTLFIYREEVEPAIIGQGTHALMALQDVGHRFTRRLDADRETRRDMDVSFAVVDRLPGQPGAQVSAIALDDADAANNI